MMNMKNIFNSRRVKYGSIAVLFTIIFVVIMIVINLIVTALDDKYGFKYDMTSSQIFTISKATEDILKNIDTEVTFKFLMPLDKVAASELGKYVKECADSYAKKFPNIKIEYIDMVRYPAQVNKYKESGNIFTTSVIVESSLRHKILPISAFFVVGEDAKTPVGFNGEMKLTSAILQVTNPTQSVVTFTQSHGETIPAKLVEVFTNAGFLVEKKDISVESINPDTKIIVINNPTSDFLGLNASNEGNISEIEILNNYMNNFGHVMVFLSADNTNKLPELEALISTRGLHVNRGVKIKDASSALSADGYTAFATYAGEMYGGNLNSNITGRTIVSNAAPIDILFTDKEVSESTGQSVYKYDTIYVDPVLSTSENALVTLQDKSQKSGTFYTMVLSSKFDYVDNQKKYSHMLVTSTDSFANYIGSNSFGNEKLLYNAMSLMGQENVPTDIEYKIFDNSILEKIDKNAMEKWSWILIVAIPLIIAAAGCAVWLRRRHK